MLYNMQCHCERDILKEVHMTKTNWSKYCFYMQYVTCIYHVVWWGHDGTISLNTDGGESCTKIFPMSLCFSNEY